VVYLLQLTSMKEKCCLKKVHSSVLSSCGMSCTSIRHAPIACGHWKLLKSHVDDWLRIPVWSFLIQNVVQWSQKSTLGVRNVKWVSTEMHLQDLCYSFCRWSTAVRFVGRLLGQLTINRYALDLRMKTQSIHSIKCLSFGGRFTLSAFTFLQCLLVF
jgi:hypothetical protein